MRLLAIDPGYERIGIAILEKKEGKEILLYSECFKTDAKLPFVERLLAIGTEIARVIKKYKPNGLAIEKLYMTTNQKTAMQVAEARGVVMYEASKLGLEIFEYTPMEIKVAVTGYGKATKDDVFFMVKKLIELPKDRKIIDDEIDAIAVGLTCFACQKFK
jgi:crossover junction endodeoxyribonuclease RuvC